MSRIDAALARGRPGLICYLPLGDPVLGTDAAALYAAAGVDVLEVGIPGGRPSYDGPTIASSLRRALDAGTTLARAGKLLADIRSALPQQAIVAMTYPQYDLRRYREFAAAAGIDGLLFPAPAQRFVALAAELEAVGVDLIHFLRYEPSDAEVAGAVTARGYVMLQASPGASGTQTDVPDRSAAIGLLRARGVRAPIALGIGISTAQQARAAVAMGADAVVVGSAVVEAAVRGPRELDAILRSLREALPAS